MRTNPRPNPCSIGFFYPENYGPYLSTRDFRDSLQHSTGWLRWIHNTIFSTNPKPLPTLPPGKLLEIGCASGSFLHEMNRQGWQVEGIEFSKSVAEYARSKGYTVRVGALESLSGRHHDYDLIVGWHVLEHLHDPVSSLKKLHAWAKPGGWLVLSLPDAGALEFKIFKDAWYALMLPTHLFHFTTSTLDKMLRLAGWRVERIIWEENPKNLLASLSYCCRDRHWTKLASFISDVGDGRRLAHLRILLGKLLARLHNSGRIVVWTTRIEA